MQTLVAFIILFTVSVADDGDVYVYNMDDYENDRRATEHSDIFDFGYHSDEMLKMNIYLKNKPENMRVDVYLKYSKDFSDSNTDAIKYEINEKLNYFKIAHLLKSGNISIVLDLSTNSGFCTKEIVKAKSQARGTRSDVTYYDICLKEEPCIVEVELSRSECKDTIRTYATANPFLTDRNIETTPKRTSTNNNGNNQHTSQRNVFVYVIPPLIVTCVIILVVCISVKKYRHRNSQPEGAIELNTYATASEVVYAALSLAHVNSEPPSREETPYARIIGVMKPVT